MKKEMWLIWKEPITRRRYKIGVLSFDNDIYTFKYTNPELNEAINAGFKFYPGFNDVNKEYKSNQLFANIETRLPNTRRPDYLEILNRYGLDKNSSKMEILKTTKGRLITDNYEFVPAFDVSKVEFDVASTRRSTDIKNCLEFINVNDRLELELEPENEYDKNAIRVNLVKKKNKYHLGYVPRYYSKDLAELLESNIGYSALIQNLNFESEISDEDITVFVKLIFDK